MKILLTKRHWRMLISSVLILTSLLCLQTATVTFAIPLDNRLIGLVPAQTPLSMPTAQIAVAANLKKQTPTASISSSVSNPTAAEASTATPLSTPTSTVSKQSSTHIHTNEPISTQKPGIPPSDIKGHWAEEYAVALTEAGIIQGYEDGTIRPDQNITRNEAIVILVKLMNLQATGNSNMYKCFKDNETIPDWSRSYLNTALNHTLIEGFEDRTFRGNSNLTRAQAVVMLVRILSITKSIDTSIKQLSEYKNYNHKSNLVVFKDFNKSYWATPYLDTALSHEILSGYPDKTVKPDNKITRGELFKMVMKISKGFTYFNGSK